MARPPITTTPLLLSLIFLLLSLSSSQSSHFRSSSRRTPPRFPTRFSHLNKPQLTTPQRQKQQYKYETRYFEQRLDHFSFSDDLPTFSQRYLINTEHWVGPNLLGPIFLYCGNEGEIVWFAENTGLVWELAPRFGAMVIFPEHRYYGESVPYGSLEEAYKNATTLSHLTTEQAIADFAVLITDLKQNLSAQACPVVLFGGSYGGMLAAWMRLKYPHIAIGALASSAPILQFEDIVPPETFYDIVSNSFRHESTSCFNTIKESWDALDSEGSQNDGLLQLTKTFHFCQKLESVDDLYNWLDSAYSYLAMVNYPYPANFMMPLPGNPIKEVCRKIDNCPEGTSVLERIFEGVSVYYNYTGEYDCFQLDDDPHGLDGWNWQACTEMVMPMSASQNTSMYPASDFNYTYYKEDCWNSFHVKPRPKWITTEFGGHGYFIYHFIMGLATPGRYVFKICMGTQDRDLDFKTALKMFGSNIIFANGLLDPWSGGGVLEDVSETIVALVTEKGAHHLDLRAATAEDPGWLVDQRASEIKLIEGWLHDYYREKKAFFAS